MMASSRIAGPVRGPGGPASVTSWRQLTRARIAHFENLPCGHHEIFEGCVLNRVEIDVDVFQGAGEAATIKDFGHGEIAAESGGDFERVEARLQSVDALHHLERNFGGAVERLFDERGALGLGALVGEPSRG